MKDKGGCVTSPVRINKLFLTKPICERMLQCTLTTKTKRAPMSRQPEPPNVRKHDLIKSYYKAKPIIIYALHQSPTSFRVLLHHQADVGNKATRLIPRTLVSQCTNQSPLFIEIIGQSRGLLNQSYQSTNSPSSKFQRMSRCGLAFEISFVTSSLQQVWEKKKVIGLTEL